MLLAAEPLPEPPAPKLTLVRHNNGESKTRASWNSVPSCGPVGGEDAKTHPSDILRLSFVFRVREVR